jgi:hypothetical protein
MLVLGMTFLRRMIVPHVSHHQQMRERAKQDYSIQQDVAQRDFKKKYCCKGNNRDQAA